MAERLGWQFGKLWTASTASALGSGVATIAAPLYVAAHTKSPLIVSATAGASWLPWLLFALPGGVLVDRVDRRRLMVLIDWSRVAVMAVLATALLGGWGSIGLLDAVLFLINAGEVVFRSASQALIPAVVPRASLERANGWLIGGVMVTQNMLAGPLSGFLFVLAASLPFFLNAGTYVASAALVGLLAGAYRAPPRGKTAQTIRGELAEGFRWLLRQRMLRTMTQDRAADRGGPAPGAGDLTQRGCGGVHDVCLRRARGAVVDRVRLAAAAADPAGDARPGEQHEPVHLGGRQLRRRFARRRGRGGFRHHGPVLDRVRGRDPGSRGDLAGLRPRHCRPRLRRPGRT